MQRLYLNASARCRLGLVTAVFLPMLATGCSRHIEEEEPPVRFERRTEACIGWCEVKMDPDCGVETHFPDLEACIDQCTSEESVNWGLQPDGTDACFDEQVEYFACFDESSCEVRRQWFDQSTTDHPCHPYLEILSECNREARGLSELGSHQTVHPLHLVQET